MGLARSSSVKPVPLSIARAPARSGPSVRAALMRFAGSDGRLYGSLVTVRELLSARREGEGRRPPGSAAASSATHASTASSRAQTTTVGPEPEIVAPSAPGGRSPRTSARSGAFAARCGSCRRSSRASAKSSADPVASAAPSSAARAVVNDASAWSTCSGSAARAAAVETVASGTSAIGTAGGPSASRATRPSQVRQTPPASAAARLSA